MATRQRSQDPNRADRFNHLLRDEGLTDEACEEAVKLANVAECIYMMLWKWWNVGVQEAYQQGTKGDIEENIERFWLNPPLCTVYDPTSDDHEQ